MNRINLLLVLFALAGCLALEKSERQTTFKNIIPEGGPTLDYETDNHDAFPISVSNIKSYLDNEELIFIFDESLKWLAMETEIPFKNLHGLTAHELVGQINALKEKQYK